MASNAKPLSTQQEEGYNPNQEQEEEVQEDPQGEKVEPYGAQILRRIHEDHSTLMEDYHEMLGPLENDHVREYCTGMLENIEGTLTLCEELFETMYLNNTNHEVEPLEGSMPVDNGREYEEEEEDQPLDDIQPDQGEDEEEVEPDSEDSEEEEPTPEEAIEGMEREKEERKAKKKSYGLERCKKAIQDFQRKSTPHERLVTLNGENQAPGHEGDYINNVGEINRQQDEHIDQRWGEDPPEGPPSDVRPRDPKRAKKKDLNGEQKSDPHKGKHPGLPEVQRTEETRMRQRRQGYDEHISGRLIDRSRRHGEITRTSDMAHPHERQQERDEETNPDTGEMHEPKSKSLHTQPLGHHERGCVTGARDFLSHLSSRQGLEDEDRMNAFHHGATLEGIGQIKDMAGGEDEEEGGESASVPGNLSPQGTKAHKIPGRREHKKPKQEAPQRQHGSNLRGEQLTPEEEQTASQADSDITARGRRLEARDEAARQDDVRTYRISDRARNFPLPPKLEESQGSPPPSFSDTPQQGEANAQTWKPPQASGGGLHPHRKCCQDTSVFLKSIAFEKAFGESHRGMAGHFRDMLNDISNADEYKPKPKQEPGEVNSKEGEDQPEVDVESGGGHSETIDNQTGRETTFNSREDARRNTNVVNAKSGRDKKGMPKKVKGPIHASEEHDEHEEHALVQEGRRFGSSGFQNREVAEHVARGINEDRRRAGTDKKRDHWERETETRTGRDLEQEPREYKSLDEEQFTLKETFLKQNKELEELTRKLESITLT